MPARRSADRPLAAAGRTIRGQNRTKGAIAEVVAADAMAMVPLQSVAIGRDRVPATSPPMAGENRAGAPADLAMHTAAVAAA